MAAPSRICCGVSTSGLLPPKVPQMNYGSAWIPESSPSALRTDIGSFGQAREGLPTPHEGLRTYQLLPPAEETAGHRAAVDDRAARHFSRTRPIPIRG